MKLLPFTIRLKQKCQFQNWLILSNEFLLVLKVNQKRTFEMTLSISILKTLVVLSSFVLKVYHLFFINQSNGSSLLFSGLYVLEFITTNDTVFFREAKDGNSRTKVSDSFSSSPEQKSLLLMLDWMIFPKVCFFVWYFLKAKRFISRKFTKKSLFRMVMTFPSILLQPKWNLSKPLALFGFAFMKKSWAIFQFCQPEIFMEKRFFSVNSQIYCNWFRYYDWS